MKIRHFAIFLFIFTGLSAETNLDLSTNEILDSHRITRIPQVILALEDRALKSVQAESYISARDDLKKAIQLKQAIGMKESEGNAKLLVHISKIESKLGNGCEAKQLSRLAKQIYLRIGMNLGAVGMGELPAAPSCSEVSWLKD